METSNANGRLYLNAFEPPEEIGLEVGDKLIVYIPKEQDGLEVRPFGAHVFPDNSFDRDEYVLAPTFDDQPEDAAIISVWTARAPGSGQFEIVTGPLAPDPEPENMTTTVVEYSVVDYDEADDALVE